MHFTEPVPIEATGHRPLLVAGGRSGEITTDSIAGDLQLTSNPLAPKPLAGQLADPIHDLRLQHPGVLLRKSQVDACKLRLARLRLTQVDHIRNESVHNPSSTNVQEGGQF